MCPRLDWMNMRSFFEAISVSCVIPAQSPADDERTVFENLSFAVERGEIVEKAGKPALLANGVEFSLDGYVAGEPLQAGRKVVLGVRPEHVKVNEDGPGADHHQATVDIEEPMGADNLLWLKHAGHTMSVRVAGARRFAPGTAVKLSFDMGLASLFDAQTEERI